MTRQQFFCICSVIVVTHFTLSAQVPAFKQVNVPVFVNNQPLKYPFAGGLNAPQFSAADLNHDGANDLVLFDRAGDIVLTFINNLTGGTEAYYYAPEYARTFPPLEDYMIMRDYNKDGAPDIFCAPFGNVAAQEMRVFRGYYQDNVLQFEPVYFNYPNCTYCNPLYVWYPDQVPGLWNNFPIAPSDYPSVDDVDGDGDQDIIAFSAGNSTKLSFLKNMSVEKGFGTDSLHYELADICWGKIFENGLERCRSRLSPSPDECATPFTSGEVEDRNGAGHPGATVLTFDRDNDGDKDLILGNISYDCLNYMRNGGTPQNAWMVEQDTTFPKEDVPVDLLSFPAAYFLDINNDDVKDLIVAPNSPSINEDRANVWWYKTVQNGNVTDFKLESKKLFTSEMIDLGTATHPAFADVNGDDLVDMVVGNYGYYTPPGPDQPAVYTNTRLYLYLNTGTFAAPEFILQDTDWLGMSEFAPNEYDLAPTFGDLDGDGDLDLVVGNNNGYLYTYFNAGGPGNAMNLTRDTDPLWLTMDVGQISTPVIYDLDGDGLMDIVVGEKTGNINFYKNIGTPTEPSFNPDETAAPNIANLGAINTQTIPNGIGHSAPQFINTNSGLLLITGTQDGHFEAYQVTGATANPYPLVDAKWGGVDVGWRSTPAFADLDEDGTLEMVAGNVRGGVSLFRTILSPFTPPVNTSNLVEDVRFQLQPNPATDLTQLLISGKTGTSFEWTVYDLLGRRVTGGHTTTKSIDIATATWPKGVYVVTVSDGHHLATKKLICN